MREGSGWVKFSISLVILLIGVTNIFIQYSKTGNVFDRPHLSFLLILFSILIYFAGTKYVISTIFIVLGVLTLIDPANISDLTPSLLFIFAFHLVKKPKYSIVLFGITLIGISARATRMGMTVYQASILFLGFAFMYACYYFIIYRSLPKPINNSIKQLSEDENKLLQLMVSGYEQQEAGRELGHKNKQKTSLMMKSIREKLNIEPHESNYKVISLYHVYGK